MCRIGDCSRLPGSHISGRRPGARLALAFLKQMAREADELDATDARVFSEHALDVLASAIRAERGFGYYTENPPQTALLSRIMEFLEANLNETSLSPPTIAAAHRISTRYLHKLFNASDLSVGAWIRVRRLARCHADLCDSSLADFTITEIALRRGFNDAAHFSRIFKLRYGKSPRSVRSQIG